MKNRRLSQNPERGSLLIVAMGLCIIIALTLTYYLQLGRTAMTLSNRAFYTGAAMDLAENGLEQAVYALNQTVSDATYSWTTHGWTIVNSSQDAQQKWTNYTFYQGVTGQVQAYVQNYNNSAAPTVISRSKVSFADNSGAATEKWILVQLRKTSKFSNGLVAKNSITFNGNTASVDSWNSVTSTGTQAYSTTDRHDNGSVGSISVSTNAINVGNADIWGYASTGGSQPNVGPNGTIASFSSPQGTVDSTRVSTDFTSSFDAVTYPTTSTSTSGSAFTISYNQYTTNSGVIKTSIQLPGSYSAAADGNYYIMADSFTKGTLEITKPNVILVFTNTSTDISLQGNDGITIDSGASLKIYGPGDMAIGGNGILNGGNTTSTAQQPIDCQIYGTKSSPSQNISVAGNGVLSAVVYAPNGNLTINGNGDVMGSMVGNNVTVAGSASFHYDESLANFGGNNPYRVSKWQELTSSTDRATYASKFSGW